MEEEGPLAHGVPGAQEAKLPGHAKQDLPTWHWKGVVLFPQASPKFLYSESLPHVQEALNHSDEGPETFSLLTTMSTFS